MSNENRKKVLVSVEQKLESVQRLDEDKTAKKWLRLWCWLCYWWWLQAEKKGNWQVFCESFSMRHYT